MVDEDDRAERRARVKALTVAGCSAQQIADRVGCSRRQVTRDRRALGILQRPPREALTEEQLSTAQALLEDGCSRSEVARTLGVYESTIRRRFPGHVWSAQQIADHTATIQRGRRR